MIEDHEWRFINAIEFVLDNIFILGGRWGVEDAMDEVERLMAAHKDRGEALTDPRFVDEITKCDAFLRLERCIEVAKRGLGIS